MKKRASIGLLLLVVQLSFAQVPGIAVTNGTAKITWPLTNYYCLFQSKTNLAATNSWSDVGSASPVTVIFSSGASRLTNVSGDNIIFTQKVAAAPQFFRLKGPAFIPVFGFSIFYDGLLEFTGSATLQINGTVHANGPIYVGTVASASQTFNETVTTTSTISSPAIGGQASSNLIGLVAFNGNPPFITNLPAIVSMVGPNNRHVIIEIPPASESVSSQLGQMRLYNQAQLILLVTNAALHEEPLVKVIMQTSFNGLLPGDDSAKFICILTNASTAYLQTNSILKMPFLSLTNKFVDQRQHTAKKQYVTQVDVNQLNDWLRTNSVAAAKFALSYPTILYVADQRNTISSTQAVVRLTRATSLPYNNGLGFTVATQNPLYVWGNYNITVNSNTYATTVGSTTNGASVPAALIADAITILSPSWIDANSAAAFSSRGASSMTVNAAMLCGNVPSTGTDSTNFSGGVHNLTRFLENWAGDTLTYNTSLVCLFSSQMATNQWQVQHNSNPSGYYDPPTRNWGFDVNFLNPSKLPPGTPIYSLP